METSRGDSEPPPAHRGRGKGAENLPYVAHSRSVGHRVGWLGKYCVELKNVRCPISMSRGQLLWGLRGSGVSQGTVVLQTKLLYLRKLSLFNQNGRALWNDATMLTSMSFAVWSMCCLCRRERSSCLREMAHALHRTWLMLSHEAWEISWTQKPHRGWGNDSAGTVLPLVPSPEATEMLAIVVQFGILALGSQSRDDPWGLLVSQRSPIPKFQVLARNPFSELN